ncbi:extracellular solute-binding protein [Tessaracoccus sp. ZS01]|uniref:extracellular solute-binding protein n=1 Tax=Tessaracoccus sp. ZS01 TaxID=1906324 RepID=UPI00096F3BB6|nr:extracellular solute-binding protein [Tessaracoccus sp. ZS01]MCG6567854.1 sugar ABC transporter substrate-binding protein [Tessaracoccus sp. ZS01]OMG55339.1 hypothetical protein BJN44_09535 [Tessaracoccus sp. ZS01]
MLRSKKILAVVGSLALLGAGCSGGAQPGGTEDTADASAPAGKGGVAASAWAVQSSQSDSFIAAVDRWNADHPEAQIDLQVMPDNGYKDKVRVALGAGEAPTLIYGWGGGGLRDYVDQGLVESLTELTADEYPEIIDRYLPAAMGAASVDGDVYGVPVSNMQPVVFLYNKEVMGKLGVEPPETWSELMEFVDVANEADIAPFALAGQSKWPQLPWLAYLIDRQGGPEVFQAIEANEPDAWKDPAILEAATKIQDLVQAEGFVSDYAAISYESGAADALVYTGKAAAILMLSNAYSNIGKAAPEFVESGNLGFFTFPEVEGGAGDPANVTGNPANLWSVTSAASEEEKKVALQFLDEQVMNDEYVDEIIGRSGVPGVKIVEEKLADSDDEFSKFVFDIVAEATYFQLSLDQALSPEQGQALNTALDQLFLLQTTPEEFVETMNATIRS